MDFKEISIEDKKLFDSYFAKFKQNISELTFTNLFMWRKYYKFKYAEICGMLCIVSETEDRAPFAFAPVGNIEGEELNRVINYLKEYFSKKGWQLRLERVNKDALNYLKKFVSDESDIIYERDASDYVYACSDLINLKGKKYDGKRNHINKFKKTYRYKYTGFDSQNASEYLLSECIRILNEWCEQRGGSTNNDIKNERTANIELIENFTKLNCKAALVEVDGTYEAFTVGEMLNDNTAVIHIEKAKSSINGLYAFINQQFCEKEWSHAEFINREQDLGIEGLRKAKLSYNPRYLIDKYNVIIR